MVFWYGLEKKIKLSALKIIQVICSFVSSFIPELIIKLSMLFKPFLKIKSS